jgi:hypothetical protein
VKFLTREDYDEITKHMPASGPHLDWWCRLHAAHIIALEQGNLIEACYLADAKYKVYLEAFREQLRESFA